MYISSLSFSQYPSMVLRYVLCEMTLKLPGGIWPNCIAKAGTAETKVIFFPTCFFRLSLPSFLPFVSPIRLSHPFLPSVSPIPHFQLSLPSVSPISPSVFPVCLSHLSPVSLSRLSLSCLYRLSLPSICLFPLSGYSVYSVFFWLRFQRA